MVLAFLKKIIKSNDLFYTSEIFRFQESTKYKTVTGGFVSLLIIATVFGIFGNMLKITLEQKSLSSTLSTTKSAHPTLSTLNTQLDDSSFMFAIRINEENYTNIKQYFDVQFLSHQMEKGISTNSTTLTLQPCTKTHWKNQPKLLSYFDNIYMEQWLCPSMDLTLNLRGKKYSQAFSSQEIRVSACKNVTNSSKTCKSTQQIEAYFAQNSDQLTFSIYYINELINPGIMDYKSVYIEDRVNIMFGPKQGTKSSLSFKDYNMVTDISIFPVQYYVRTNGVISQQLPSMQPFTTSINGSFVNFYLVKSTDSLMYTRQVLKISFVISFIGGCIGVLASAFFIIRMFTSFSFGKAMANTFFEKEKIEANDQQNENEQTTFFDYLKSSLYACCSCIGNKLNWKQNEYSLKCQQEVAKQLDIKYLLSRLSFVEYCVTNQLRDTQIQQLVLNRPKTLQDIKKFRQKCMPLQQKASVENQKKKNKEVKFQQDNKQDTSKMFLQSLSSNTFHQNEFLAQKKDEILIQQISSIKSQQKGSEAIDTKSIFLFEPRYKQQCSKLKKDKKTTDNVKIKVTKKNIPQQQNWAQP